MSIRLEIEPAYRAALEAAGLMSFDAFMNAKAGTPVSRHRHRETVPLEIEVDGSPKKFFLKRVFRVPPAHAILPWLRFKSGYSQPAREWAACKSMRDAGLPAMERVAFGERRTLGVTAQAFILVAASSVRYSLEDWLIPGFSPPQLISPEARRALIASIGRLARDIESAGFDWGDAVAKHVLTEPIQRDEQVDWAFCLIDLERVSRSGGRGAALESIAKSLSPLRFDRDELRAVYDAEGEELDRLVELWNGYAVGGCGTILDDDLRQVDPYFHPRRYPMERLNNILVSPRYRDAIVGSGLTSLDAVFSLDRGLHLTKPGLAAHRDRIQLELDHGGGIKRAAYLKRYRQPPLRAQLRRIVEGGLKRSTARLEARFARRLTEIGIGTLSVIAYGQEVSNGIERRSFIITDEVAGESLEKVADEAKSGVRRIAPTDKFEIIRQLASLARRMHGEGYYHRDFYLCHLFLGRNPDGCIVLRVIDLGRMIRRFMGYRWMIKDLAALSYSAPEGLVTRADRLRFLYHYENRLMSGSGWRESRQQMRSTIAAIGRRIRKMAAHDAKRAARHQRSQNKA